MIPKRFYGITFSAVLAFIMTFFVSGVSTLKSIGVSWPSVQIWMENWMYSYLVAFPVLVLVRPLVVWLVGKLVADTAEN